MIHLLGILDLIIIKKPQEQKKRNTGGGGGHQVKNALSFFPGFLKTQRKHKIDMTQHW